MDHGFPSIILRSLRTGFSVAGSFVLILLLIDSGGFGAAAATSPQGLAALAAVLFGIGAAFSSIRFLLFVLEGEQDYLPVPVTRDSAQR